MIRIGIIGIGFMGVTHYKAFREVEGALVVAIATRDKQKLCGDWRSIQGNFGEAGGMQDLSHLARYENWQDLLADEDIDVVDICLPTHLHRKVAIAALEAGKHVLVEKPLALTLEDCDAMIAAARQAGRMLMVGHVLRFFPAFAEAHEIVRSGKFGALLGAHFKRVIAMPQWASDDHFMDVSKSGGPAIDLHIHDTDFIHFLAGVPAQVRAVGIKAKNAAITFLQTQYVYEGEKPCLTCQSGAVAMPGLPFEHGFDIYLEKATLKFNNLLTGENLWIYTGESEKESLQPQRPEAFVAQLQHVAECISTGVESPLINAAAARLALKVCLLEQQSVLSGKAVAVETIDSRN